jgi:hypothetical protein
VSAKNRRSPRAGSLVNENWRAIWIDSHEPAWTTKHPVQIDRTATLIEEDTNLKLDHFRTIRPKSYEE